MERTAYPQFKRVVSARELRETFTPTIDEIRWAREKTGSEQHLLALVVLLKAVARLGHFPVLFEVPIAIVEHVRIALEVKPDIEPGHDSDRTLRFHKSLVRERLGITSDPERARAVAEAAIREAARTKDNPPDLINVALEELVRARLELPGYTTLDEMVGTIRTQVNTAVFAGIAARMNGPAADEVDALLKVDPIRRRSQFDQVKTVAGAPTVGNVKDHVKHLAWLDALGPTEEWLEGVSPAKVAHFAGEASQTDVADLGRYGTARRQALIVCLVHTARVRTRDEVAAMFCKRIAAIHKRAKERLESIREASRAESERLLDTFGEVLAVVREALGVSAEDQVVGETNVPDSVCVQAGRMVLGALAQAGGVTALTSAHEEVSAHHGNNYLPFVEKYYRGSRAALFQVLDVLDFQPTSSDHSLFKRWNSCAPTVPAAGSTCRRKSAGSTARTSIWTCRSSRRTGGRSFLMGGGPDGWCAGISRRACSRTWLPSCVAATWPWSGRSRTPISLINCCRRSSVSRWWPSTAGRRDCRPMPPARPPSCGPGWSIRR